MYKSILKPSVSKSYIVVFAVCFLLIMGFGIREMLAQDPEAEEVKLYFMAPGEAKLAIEKRSIERSGNVVERIKLTLAELIKGPITDLIPTIPQGVEVREVFVDEKGCAYIDFSRTISQNHPGGTTGELVTIASIVNTLAENFPKDVRKVRILIAGKEAKTIAGHINISRPIFPFKLD